MGLGQKVRLRGPRSHSRAGLARGAHGSGRRGLLACCVGSFAAPASAQGGAREKSAPQRYFLPQAPPASVLSNLPQPASRAFIAKVRLLTWGTTLPDPTQYFPPGSARGAQPPPRPYQLEAEFEVVERLAGSFVWWRRQRSEFVPPDHRARYVMPFPPERKTTEYFVVSFLDARGVRTLLGFPVSDEEYRAWYRRLHGRDECQWLVTCD